MKLPEPKFEIDKELDRFLSDPETARAESTLGELLTAYSENIKIEHVLTKVITINALYHARVLDVDLHPLAMHISTIEDLGNKLKHGSPDAVDAIWKSKGTRRHYFSFATKFCSWHNQEGYAIYDTNMWEALRAYRAEEPPFRFKNAECNDYACLHAIVKRFQSAYDLEAYSLKNVDKFLWLVGDRLIKAKLKNKTQGPDAASDS